MAVVLLGEPSPSDVKCPAGVQVLAPPTHSPHTLIHTHTLTHSPLDFQVGCSVAQLQDKTQVWEQVDSASSYSAVILDHLPQVEVLLTLLITLV